PNDIREIAVLTHESIVRSNARRVRSTASLVAGLALVESPPARSVTESDPWLSDQGLCAHEPARSRIKPGKPRRSDVDPRQLARPLSSTPTVYATPGEPSPENSRCCRTREGRPQARSSKRPWPASPLL